MTRESRKFATPKPKLTLRRAFACSLEIAKHAMKHLTTLWQSVFDASGPYTAAIGSAAFHECILTNLNRKTASQFILRSFPAAALLLFCAAGAQAANTLTVNSLADTSDNSCGSTCTLRDAINQADNDYDDTIRFNRG